MDFDNDDFPASETDIMPESELPPYVSEREVSTIAEEKSLLDTDFSIICKLFKAWDFPERLYTIYNLVPADDDTYILPCVACLDLRCFDIVSLVDIELLLDNV